MSRYQYQVKIRDRAACDGVMTRCPHCGESLTWEPEPERIRWYIADAGKPAHVSALGAKLLDSIRTNGQAVYVSADGGKTIRRMGVAAAAGGQRITTEEREPIILTPEEFQRNWRQAGPRKAPTARTFSAGGAR